MKAFGLSKTSFYRTYYTSKSRCNKKNCPTYERYGARGIKFEWDSFTKFKNDMYASYVSHVEKFGQRNTTLERIDNSGNYCKKNCRWATPKEQARNKRNNRYIKFKNKNLCISDWAKQYGLSHAILSYRINSGWPVHEAIETPIQKRHTRKTTR